MKNNYNICLIGAGYMAEEYLKVLSDKKLNCFGIYSRTISKINYLKKKYDIKKNFKNIREINNSEEIDSIIIAVNETSTFEILKKLNLKKFKILCEKPVGVNYYESQKILKLIKKNRSSFFVSMNRRYFNSTLKAKYYVKNKTGKRFIYINDQQIQNRKKVSVNKQMMYGNSVHLIDYINMFGRGNLKKIIKIKKYEYRKMSETISKIFLSSGDEILYTCNWNSAGGWSVNIIQNNQRCELKPLENLMHEELIKGKRIRKKYHVKGNDIKFKPGLYLLITEFLKMLNGKRYHLISFKDYFKTVEMIKKIYG